MKKVLIILCFICNQALGVGNLDESEVKFSRYIMVETCYDAQEKCIGPVVKNLENSNTSLVLKPFSKGKVLGRTAVEKFRVEDSKIPFNSEIRVTKKEGSNDYLVNIMLRSGDSLKRNGRVRTIQIKNLSDFKEVTVEDKPIRFKNGTLKASVVIGPYQEIFR